MFSIARKKILESTQWHSAPPNQVRFIEAWKFSDSDTATTENFRHGFLYDQDIEKWLSQVDAHAPPKPKSSTARLEGGIRLLICEREFYRPLSFSMSKESFLRAEEKLQLAPATLLSFSQDNGVFSRYMTYDKLSKKARRIAIVIKAPQKFQIANYGLSLSHDFDTGLTTALLYGTGALPTGSDHVAWSDCQSAEILELIEAAPTLWAYPMLLPLILMEHHIRRAQIFCTVNQEDELLTLQDRLGVTQAGRRHRKRPKTDPGDEGELIRTRRDLGLLTADMSTYMTEAVWFDGLSEWQCAAMAFLSRTLDEITEFLPQGWGERTREFKESVAYADAAARCLKIYNSKTKEALEPDFSVLYSFIAQIDNRLSAKMAASTSRDSTAMKALAFLTTLFLPGTFVASVFSTSMFDFLSPNADPTNSRIISSYFWVYWIVTIPLTVVVATGWRLWWHWEKLNFKRDVLLEIEDIDSHHPRFRAKSPSDSSRSHRSGKLHSLNRFLGRRVMTESMSATERGSVGSVRAVSGEYAPRPENERPNAETSPHPGPMHYAQPT